MFYLATLQTDSSGLLNIMAA